MHFDEPQQDEGYHLPRADDMTPSPNQMILATYQSLRNVMLHQIPQCQWRYRMRWWTEKQWHNTQVRMMAVAH